MNNLPTQITIFQIHKKDIVNPRNINLVEEGKEDYKGMREKKTSGAYHKV